LKQPLGRTNGGGRSSSRPAGFSLLTYLLLVLTRTLAPPVEPIILHARASLIRQGAPLLLAMCSLLLGLIRWDDYLSVPLGALSSPLFIEVLPKVLLPFLGGAALAILLGRWEYRPDDASSFDRLVTMIGPVRRATLALAGFVERTDGMLRQWPAASLSLLALALLFGAAMFFG